MVGGDEHNRARHFAAGVECLKETRELAVHERDLPVVERLAKAFRQVCRRLIWRVWIVVVNPEEPWGQRLARRRTGCWEPAEHCIGRRIREPLDVGRPPPIGSLGQPIVIRFEPAIETEAAIEGESGHEGRSTVARLAEILGRRFHLWRQHVAAVVPEAVAERRLTGEDRRV